MSLKTPREGESPSATTTLLPQLRSSRRGSTSSLSSIHVLGKETIAQALDQIHSSASQSETLTTFNEYTSPPSSSAGQEGKSIAGELQGGISGLYNRFRASVGNVKDLPSSDTPEEVAEKTSHEPSRSPTPASTISQAGSRGSKKALDNGGQQSYSVKQTTQADDGPTIERMATLRPPLTQPSGTARPPHHDRAGSTDSRLLDDYQRRLSRTKELQIADVIHLDPKRTESIYNGDDQVPLAEVSQEHIQEKSQVERPFSHSSIGDGRVKDKAIRQEFPVGRADVPQLPIDRIERDLKYQHLEIPLRRSLAPPIVSRSASPGPNVSRTSSIDTNAESVLVMPSTTISSPKLDKDPEQSQTVIQSSSKEPPVIPDSRVMSVFSQAKSKVLSKEYWMKDENAKDCFGCGDAFSTFRRKHHCRKSKDFCVRKD